MKDKLGCLIPVALLLLVFGWLYFFDTTKEKKEQQIKGEISRLALKHNAVVGWRKRFANRDKLYSYELQKALVSRDGHPVVFVASIEDVSQANGIFYVTFFEMLMGADIRFIISCDSVSALKLMKESVDEADDRFAIVATVSKVVKPKLKIGEILQDEYSDGAEFETFDTYLA